MLKIGDVVNYHSIIGGPVTSEGHEITHIQLMPNNFGCDVAWITGKSGCVAIAALSNETHPMKPYEKPLSRKKQQAKDRYDRYISSEYSDSFADFLGIATECRYSGGGYQFVNWDRRLFGPVCHFKKDAKAGFKEMLKSQRA